jgi:hypothetical protein
VGQVANLPEPRQIGNLPHRGVRRVCVNHRCATPKKADDLFMGVSAQRYSARHSCQAEYRFAESIVNVPGSSQKRK